MISTQHHNRIEIEHFRWLDKMVNSQQGRGSITGNPPTDDWVNYATTQSCPTGTTCNADFAGQVVKFRNQVVPNPCVSLCSGSIYAVSVDSKGKPRENDIIKVNNIQNGTTNNNGEHKINFTNAACGLKYNISAYCSHNVSKLCRPSQKQSSLDFQNDNDTVIFDCNVCINESDLFIGLSDIRIKQFSGDIYSINVTLHSENIGGNVNVTAKGQNKNTGLIERENSTIITISSTDTLNSTIVNLDITNINYLNIYVSTDVAEPKSNNYVLRPFVRNPIKAYLEVKTGNDKVNEAIENYLTLFVNKQDSPSSNYLNIIIGRKGNTFKNTINPYTRYSLNNDYYWDGRSIKYNGVYIGYTPYIGVVGRFVRLPSNERYIVAYGKELEGDIAAVKKLISASSLFLTESSSSYNERTVIIDNFDITGLSVMDLSNNPENKNLFNGNRNTKNFKAVVERILNDNNFEIAIKTVKTTNDNTTLRLKNINSDFSDNFRDAITNNSKPVVFAGGLFSDLTRWEENNGLAKQIIQDGRDSWEIELTGGPTIDSDCQPGGTYNCPNYNYQQLVDYYWPALISGVEKYSGQNKLDYVGHSNGCRVALDSLKNYSTTGKNNAGYYFDTTTGSYQFADLASSPVDIFVGLGCPALLNGSSRFINKTKIYGDATINSLSQRGFTHITNKNYGILVDSLAILMWPFGPKISLNLMSYYKDLAKTNSGKIPGAGLSLNKVYLIAGDYSNIFIESGTNNDFLVPIQDMISINKSLNYTTGELIIKQVRHDHMIEDGSIQKYIRSRLRGD